MSNTSKLNKNRRFIYKICMHDLYIILLIWYISDSLRFIWSDMATVFILVSEFMHITPFYT